MLRTNQRRLWRFIIGFCIDSIPGALLATLLTLRLAERGYGAAWIGAFATAPSLTYMGALLFIRPLLRRIGLRHAFRATLIVNALATLAILMIDQPELWLICAAIAGFAAGVRYTVAESWVPALAAPEQRGRAVAWFQTMLGASFLAGTGLLLLTGMQGFWLLFVTGGIIATGLLLLWPIDGPAGSPADETVHIAGSGLRMTGIAVLAAALLGGLFEAGIATAVPLYTLSLGFDTTMATWAVTAIGLGSLAQYPFGALADRFAWQRIVTGTAALIAISALLLPLTASWPWLLGLLGFVWGSAGGGLYTLATIRNGARWQGSLLIGASTVTQFAYMIGSATGPAISGVALDLSPQYGLAALVATLGLLGLAVIVVAGLNPSGFLAHPTDRAEAS